MDTTWLFLLLTNSETTPFSRDQYPTSGRDLSPIIGAAYKPAAIANWAKAAAAAFDPPVSVSFFNLCKVDFGIVEYSSNLVSSRPSAGRTAKAIPFS